MRIMIKINKKRNKIIIITSWNLLGRIFEVIIGSRKWFSWPIFSGKSSITQVKEYLTQNARIFFEESVRLAVQEQERL